MSEEQLHGPYVQAATLCENVIEGKDGVLSIIRLIDRIILTTVGPQAYEAPIPSLTTTLVVMMKAGDARGSHNLSVSLIEPSGMSKPPILETTVLFEGDDRGVNLVLPLALDLDSEGIHWFDIKFNGRTLSRVPLRLVVQRQTVTKS